jgi:glycosyl transferase family 25
MTSEIFQPLNQYFDKIYVLSLPHTTARHANVNKVLDGLSWSYFWGADKKDYSSAQVVEQRIYDDVAHKRTKRTSRSMNLGEVACALSHRNIYQNMLDEGHQRILVLEDDVLPQLEQLQHFDKVIAQLPEDWELLMLGYYGHKLPTLGYRLQQKLYLAFHYLKIANWHKVRRSWIDNICMQPHSPDIYHTGKVLGAHAYAVTASAAEKFLAYQTPVHLQADRIFNYYAAENPLSAFALKNTVFTLSELASDSYIQ